MKISLHNTLGRRLQEFQPLEIGGQHRAQAAVRAHRDLADQQPGRKHAAIARGDHTVARPDLIGGFDEIENNWRLKRRFESDMNEKDRLNRLALWHKAVQAAREYKK